MARKPKVAKLSIRPMSQPALATSARKEEEKYQLREDADRVRRYAELAQDKDRHKKVLDHIRSEHSSMMSILGGGGRADAGVSEGTVQPRGLARSGRKKSTRVPRRGARR